MGNGTKQANTRGQAKPSNLKPKFHFKIFDMSKEEDAEEYLQILNTPGFRPYPYPGGNIMRRETNWVGERLFLAMEFVSYVPESKQKKTQ